MLGGEAGQFARTVHAALVIRQRSLATRGWRLMKMKKWLAHRGLIHASPVALAERRSLTCGPHAFGRERHGADFWAEMLRYETRFRESFHMARSPVQTSTS